MSFDSLKVLTSAGGVFPRRALTIGGDESHIEIVIVYLYRFNDQSLRIELHRRSTTAELIEKIFEEKPEGLSATKHELCFTHLPLDFAQKNVEDFEIFETMSTLDGETAASA